VKKAKIFMNGQSQAVRLPKECQFEENEVFVNQVGNLVVLIPIGERFLSLKESVNEFSSDFFAERPEQPILELRKKIK